MGASLSWKTASFFGNNVWIVVYTWLSNLSTYFFAVIRPWKVIMGTRECCTTTLLPKLSQNLPYVSLLEPNQVFRIVGFLRFSPNINLLPDLGTTWRTSHLTRAFPVIRCPGFADVTPSFMHLTMSMTFNNQRFSNCSLTLDTWFGKLTSDSLWKQGPQDQYSVLLLFTFAAVGLWSFETIHLNVRRHFFCQCWFSPTTLPLRWGRLPMIRVCRHNLRKYRSQET
jgi:hypothetical protein